MTSSAETGDGTDVPVGELTASPAISVLRGVGILAGFLAFTLPLMPVQATLKRLAPRAARRFPHWYHRRACQLFGIRVHVTGHAPYPGPTLFIANHSSWLDIPVLSHVAPLAFVAKKEVGTWPGVSSLARLQNTVFVDRERRQNVGQTAGEITQRLQDGGSIVLFAEGTSTDGNRVLPFRSSLFGAALPNRPAQDRKARATTQKRLAEPHVQTAAIVYRQLHGIPIGRSDRALVSWYGDMEMVGHGWGVLKAGPLDVAVELGPAVPLSQVKNRKVLAAETEGEIRSAVTNLMRNG